MHCAHSWVAAVEAEKDVGIHTWMMQSGQQGVIAAADGEAGGHGPQLLDGYKGCLQGLKWQQEYLGHEFAFVSLDAVQVGLTSLHLG